MGAKSVAKGIRTCALLVLTTVPITDHRDLRPAPSVGAKAGPHTGVAQLARGLGPVGAAATRRGAPSRNHRRPSAVDPVRRQLYSPAEPKPGDRAPRRTTSRLH